MAIMRSERGLDRLVNFSDATVAIAITLLILPLIDEAKDLDEMSVLDFATSNGGVLFAFLISFAVIGRYWFAHHQLFEYVKAYDGRLVALNLLWLAAVAFLPFSQSGLSVAAGDRGDLDALYIGNLLALSISLLLVELHLIRSPHLLHDLGDAAPLRLYWGTIVVLLVVLALVLLFPSVGPWFLCLLFIQGPVDHLVYAIVGRLRRSRA